MNETQNSIRIRRWWPLVIGVLLVPFAYFVWRHHIAVPAESLPYIAYLIFPYTPLVFLLGQSAGIRHLPMIAALMQFPVYGVICSVAARLRTGLLIVTIAHVLAIAVLAVLFLFLWSFFQLSPGFF